MTARPSLRHEPVNAHRAHPTEHTETAIGLHADLPRSCVGGLLGAGDCRTAGRKTLFGIANPDSGE